MRKMIARLVWSEVWENIKQNFLVELMMIAIFIINYKMRSGEISKNGYALILEGILLEFMSIKMKKMPFRIYKASYACPMDEKWKLHYLSLKVGVKTIQNMVIMSLFIYMINTAFTGAENNVMWHTFQFIFLISIALWLSLDLEPNEINKNEKIIDSEGTETFHKSLALFLITECVVWLVCRIYKVNLIVLGIIGVSCIVINVVFMKKNLKSYLLKMLSYEKVYYV